VNEAPTKAMKGISSKCLGRIKRRVAIRSRIGQSPIRATDWPVLTRLNSITPSTAPACRQILIRRGWLIM